MEQRCKIEIFHQMKFSCRKIGEEIGKHHTTVSRELRRNKAPADGSYQAQLAQNMCRARHSAKRKKYLSQMKSAKEWMLLFGTITALSKLSAFRSWKNCLVCRMNVFMGTYGAIKNKAGFFINIREPKESVIEKEGNAKTKEGGSLVELGLRTVPKLLKKRDDLAIWK